MKSSLGRKRRAFVLLALCPLLGCEDPLKQGQTIEEPRALGVRMATASNQASLQPGQEAAFELLLAGPEGTLDARLSYELCEAASSTRGVPFCEAAPFAEATVDLEGSAIPVAIPADLAGAARLALLGVACLISEPRLSPEPLDWRCSSGEQPLRFSFDVRTSAAGFTNLNPDLSALTISIGGVAIPVDELRREASCDASAPVVAAKQAHEVVLALGDGAREPSGGSSGDGAESLQLSHFSTSGSFERQYSFVQGEQEASTTLWWRAPAADSPVKQYLVVRDGRGGVSWVSWSFCVR